MRILFIANNHFESNSCYHIRSFAKALTFCGHRCAIALPERENASGVDWDGIALLSFEDLESKHSIDDALGGALDVVHAWTARDHVLSALLKLIKVDVATVVHLEDPEEQVAKLYQNHWSEEGIRDPEIFKWRWWVASPQRVQPLLQLVDGVSVIIPTLREKVPAGKPLLDLLPVLDGSLYYPQDKDLSYLTSLGLEKAECVVAYTGSQGPVNRDDMAALYEAIYLMRESGVDCKLLRTGVNEPGFLESLPFDARGMSVELGFVDREKLRKVISCADFLIQPGGADDWNRYRFPSKIPEFLMAGKAIIMPRCHLLPGMEDGVHAVFTKSGVAGELAKMALHLHCNPVLRGKMGVAAREFALKAFAPQQAAINLESFYATLVEKRKQKAFAQVARALKPGEVQDDAMSIALRIYESLFKDYQQSYEQLMRAYREACAKEKQAVKRRDKAERKIEDLKTKKSALQRQVKHKSGGLAAKIKRLFGQ